MPSKMNQQHRIGVVASLANSGGLGELPVMELEGRAVGRVAALEHDALTRQLTGLVVRHGWLRKNYTRVPVQDITRMSQGLVMLTHTKAAFHRLPICDAP